MSNGPLMGSRMRKIGWAAVLLTCTSAYGALHLKVNSVKSEVRQAERRIVALREQKMMLETEFETRANQQQLANWNEVDFGYKAPTAGQFLEGERQLAQFGTPRAKGAPEPITVAHAPTEAEDSSIFPAMVSPITGQAIAAEVPRDHPPQPIARENLSARLVRPAQRVRIGPIAGGAE